MSTLRLPNRKPEKPEPALQGCRVVLGDTDTVGRALRKLKNACQRAGRGIATGRRARRHHETPGQKARRKHHAAVSRARRERQKEILGGDLI